jgi:Na+-driven multidrug efflux pump
MNNKTKKIIGIGLFIALLVAGFSHRIAGAFFTGYIEIILLIVVILLIAFFKYIDSVPESDDSKDNN